MRGKKATDRQYHISDRTAADHVEYNERDGWNYLVSEVYAPAKMFHEPTTWAAFQRNMEGMELQHYNFRFRAIALSSDLTEEQRSKRLNLLRAWYRERYGDAIFVAI